MANFVNYNQATGVQTPQQSITQPPIIAARAPTANDAAVPGQFWLYVNKAVVPNTTAGFVNLGSIAGAAQWGTVTAPNGNFAQLTVNPGPTNLTGNVNITGALTQIGTANINVNNNTDTNINSGISTGNVIIGNIATTALDLTGNAAALSSNTTLQISSNGATTISASPVNINANFAGTTNINTGTSVGQVFIGNLANAGSILIASNGAIGLNGNGDIILAGNNATATAIRLTAGNGGVQITSGVNGINLNVNTNQPTNINTGTSTGAVSIGNPLSGILSMVSGAAGQQAIQIASSAVTGGIQLISDSNTATTGVSISNTVVAASIYVSNGAPGFNAPQGSMCLNTAGNAVNNRMYINTTGANVWTAVTTVA